MRAPALLLLCFAAAAAAAGQLFDLRDYGGVGDGRTLNTAAAARAVAAAAAAAQAGGAATQVGRADERTNERKEERKKERKKERTLMIMEHKRGKPSRGPQEKEKANTPIRMKEMKAKKDSGRRVSN